MFNAKRSALYIAIIGMALASGEASAACSPSARVGGVLVCMNGKPGSFICDTQVVADPVCITEGGEGCDFGNSAFTKQTTDLTSACSYTGAAVDGDIYPLNTTLLNRFRVIPAKATPDNDQRNGPKKYKCVNGFLVGTGRRIPCTTDTTNGDDPALFFDSGQTSPVEGLGGDSVPMTCDKKGVCTATQEILPTNLYCSGGRQALDFTPLDGSSFIVTVDVEQGSEGPFAEAHFGCLGSQGNQYSCEALDDFGFPEDCDGAEGGFGHDSNKLFCKFWPATQGHVDLRRR